MPRSLIHEPKGRDGDFLSLVRVDFLQNKACSGENKRNTDRLKVANRINPKIVQEIWI